MVAETVVEDPGAVPAADLYSFSYVAEETGNTAARPVMFIFNGGPGASSVFLHLCSLGPRVLRDCTPAGTANPATPLVDNPASPLGVADLVFIDPTDTGWSHTLPGVSPGQFHSVDGDSDEVTALIVWWLRKHGRLGSPVYVYGESYGSMRGVAVVRDLARSNPKVVVTGLMLGGFAITFGRGNGTPDPIWDALRLPTAASMAWHYGKIDNKHQTWEQAVDQGRRIRAHAVCGRADAGRAARCGHSPANRRAPARAERYSGELVRRARHHRNGRFRHRFAARSGAGSGRQQWALDIPCRRQAPPGRLCCLLQGHHPICQRRITGAWAGQLRDPHSQRHAGVRVLGLPYQRGPVSRSHSRPGDARRSAPAGCSWYRVDTTPRPR